MLIVSMKYVSFKCLWICDPSKIPVLSFSIIKSINTLQMNLKHSLILSKPLMNCLTNPNLMLKTVNNHILLN